MLFQNVLADEKLKKRLVTLVKENRISHAQLFLAHPGNHDFALAVAYAQYISCENRGEWDSCGVCPSCVKYEKLSHPDFHLIFPNATTKEINKDPDSKKFAREFKAFVLKNNYYITIDEWLVELGGENKQATINIRDCANIINENSSRSYEGGYKIYILWQVERLYHSAAPKLLKTLEEPENRTLFILMAEDADKILPTILSRTQLVKIPPLSQAMIAAQLQTDYSLTQELADDIAAISEGSYNRAVNYYNERKELKIMLSRFELFFNSIVAHVTRDNSQIRFVEMQTMFTEMIGQGRETQKSFISYIIRMLRNLLHMNTHNDKVIKATSDELQVLSAFLPYVHLRNISPLLSECNKAFYHIERNGNPALIFTDLYLKIVGALS